MGPCSGYIETSYESYCNSYRLISGFGNQRSAFAWREFPFGSSELSHLGICILDPDAPSGVHVMTEPQPHRSDHTLRHKYVR